MKMAIKGYLPEFVTITTLMLETVSNFVRSVECV